LIRRAEPGDVTTLVALCAEHAAFERAAYDPDGKEARLAAALFGEAPRLWAWVAVSDDGVVGYASATEDFSTWNAVPFLSMDCLFVQPGHRNGGLGAELLGAILQFARARGLAEVQWQTPAWNADASRFYRRHGGIAQDKARFSLLVP
jgi:GNAT superfamily N-acetyltransferase